MGDLSNQHDVSASGHSVGSAPGVRHTVKKPGANLERVLQAIRKVGPTRRKVEAELRRR